MQITLPESRSNKAVLLKNRYKLIWTTKNYWKIFLVCPIAENRKWLLVLLRR
jgi:hypothetical protein